MSMWKSVSSVLCPHPVPLHDCVRLKSHTALGRGPQGAPAAGERLAELPGRTHALPRAPEAPQGTAHYPLCVLSKGRWECFTDMKEGNALQSKQLPSLAHKPFWLSAQYCEYQVTGSEGELHTCSQLGLTTPKNTWCFFSSAELCLGRCRPHSLPPTGSQWKRHFRR